MTSSAQLQRHDIRARSGAENMHVRSRRRIERYHYLHSGAVGAAGSASALTTPAAAASKIPDCLRRHKQVPYSSCALIFFLRAGLTSTAPGAECAIRFRSFRFSLSFCIRRAFCSCAGAGCLRQRSVPLRYLGDQPHFWLR